MYPPKRTQSPSGEHPDPHTVESPISVQEEITESEQELMSADDKARTPGKSSRNVNDYVLEVFCRSTKRYFWFKKIFWTIERKTQCPFCKQMLTAWDKKLKLSGKSLTEHLRRKQGAHKDVGAAFMLHEIQQDDNPTPRQAITKDTKTIVRKEL